jgi:hypothetical protein
MFSQSDALGIVKKSMETAGVKKGEDVDSDKLHKAVASAIYNVITSDEYVDYIMRKVTKPIMDGLR